MTHEALVEMPSSTQSVAEYLEKGNKCCDRGNLEEGIQAYDAALKLDPNSSKAYHSLANALSSQGKAEEAINYYRKALSINPRFAIANYRLAEMLKQQGNKEEALRFYSLAVELNSKDFRFQYSLGEALQEQGQLEEAKAVYKQAMELNPCCSKTYSKLRQMDVEAILPNSSWPDRNFQLNSEGELISVLFLMPVSGGSGGSHSVMQECLELHRAGLKASIAIDERNYSKFLKTYTDIPEIQQIAVRYANFAELAELADQFSVVCATIYNTVKVIEKLARQNPRLVPAYYIQDYEPLFSRKGTWDWQEAWESYTLVPDAILFAKTRWLCKIVSRNHKVSVLKVEPSIDHQVYYPKFGKNQSLLHLAFMARFSTPRRAPKRTLRVARKLSEIFPNQLQFTIFGSDPTAIASCGIPTPENSRVLGHLSRNQVADVLRQADIFLDLSDYQAFGRTALEAMTCGCIPVVPERGGANEFAISGVNSIVVDTTSEEDCVRGIAKLIQMERQELNKMRLNGIEKASRYSTKRAAFSIYNILCQEYFKVS